MKITTAKSCYYCGKEFGLLEEQTAVVKATKPKGTPFRWRQLGCMCVDCEIAGRKTHYEYKEQP
jgi:hypothetical protein